MTGSYTYKCLRIKNYMDKKESSYIIELLSGCKNHIFYSVKDFQEDLDVVSHGRNGIYAFSKNKVNLRLKPQITQQLKFPDFFSTGIIEQTQSIVDIESNNVFLKDRTKRELVANLDIIRFRDDIITHPVYGQKLRESETKSYDLLFQTGMELKPVLHYSPESKIVEIVGFCDDEDLQAEENSSLEDKIKSIFRKNQFDN